MTKTITIEELDFGFLVRGKDNETGEQLYTNEVTTDQVLEVVREFLDGGPPRDVEGSW